MKYQSMDLLSDFEFHDAECSLISYYAEKLVVEVKYLNIHKDANQNTSDCDMEILLARITFDNCKIVTYEPGVAWRQDASGKWAPAEPMIRFTGPEAQKRFLYDLECTTTILSFTEETCGTWKLGGCGDEPYFEALISFDHVAVEWDDFRRPAWYVLHERGIQA